MLKKIVLTASLASLMVAMAVTSAFADPVTYDLSPAADGVGSQITSVLTDVLPVAGGIVALFIGWRILKKFVKA